MFIVYVIESEGSQYVGMTTDLARRLKEHNAGKTKSTKSRKSWKLIYSESFLDVKEARAREKYLKSAAGRRFRKNLDKI